MSSNGMREVSLAQLQVCEAQYAKVRPIHIEDKPAWLRDLTSLRIAIKHAKQGHAVYAVEDLAPGERTFYLLSGDQASERIDATVCANSLGA